MLLNVTWNLPWNVSKRLVFRKLLLAHTISYIFPWKLLFTSWEWVEDDTWKKISEVSFMLRAWRLIAFCLPCENQVQTWRVSKCLVIRNLLRSLDGKEELGQNFQDWLLKRWAFQLLRLFYLWSNLYFEMLDALLISWIETYSVMLVHWFKKAHFSQKPLFLTKFDLYSWNLWIILIYKDTSSAQIYYG